MSYTNRVSRVLVVLGLVVWRISGSAGEPSKILGIEVEPSRHVLRLHPHPAAEEYKVFRSDALNKPFAEAPDGILSGYDWTSPNPGLGPVGFYRVEVTPLSDSAVLTATVLNRLAYGPTPDEIERIQSIGAPAYIDEQLAPEKIEENLKIDQASPPSTWRYITVTGTATSSRLYIYLDTEGEAYIDDIKLVRGTVPEAGANLIRNGDFESPLVAADWQIKPILEGSSIVSSPVHSGSGALHVISSEGGRSSGTAIVQDPIRPSLSSSQLYTLSFWYLPSPTKPSSLTVRLSGATSRNVQRPILAFSDTPIDKLTEERARITDLQMWYTAHAVQSKRQLLEVLTHFVDNHFTTYYTKSREYIDGRVTANVDELVATDFEFRELKKWREVLMNPNGTFYDLLKISAESPAMIIYLDTVTSKKGTANENYARELMELFTMGVDNGYDQRDIEEMSRAWTGWRVDKLPLARKEDPFAAPVANRNTDPGYWTLRFSAGHHDTGQKVIFPGKTVDDRFGPPYAGRPYELRLPARTGNAGMQDGYAIIARLADLPYTQEYISVKLCQWFLHEDFVHGVYDYTASNLSPEAALIRDCMNAWETPAADGRKGNLRNVLKVILNSQLFRDQSAARQKVKTPFEYVVSAVRAIRSRQPDGAYTSDIFDDELLLPLQELGMRLFYREDPDGWSEFGRDWISTSTLVERMRFVQDYLRVGSPNSDPVALLKLKLPPDKWRDAAAVAEFFCGLLFLGEGKANLALDSAAAVEFLNSNDAGSGPSLFQYLDPNSIAYQNRVRGMVAMLMSLPRFHEQ